MQRGPVLRLSSPSLQVGTGEKKKVMGVLDIYGFEVLEVRAPPNLGEGFPRVGADRLKLGFARGRSG